MAVLVTAGTALAQTSSTRPGSSRDTSTTPTTNDRSYQTGTGSTAAGAATGRDTVASGKLGFGDRRFVTKAADNGNDEINLAKLATERATNPEVKSFAQKLVDDHSMVASELKTIASAKNVKLDDDDDKDRAYKRLSKKTGAEFDQEFVEHMVDEHEKNIKLFEKAAKDAKDPEVRSFASKHIDHLRQHLQQAQGLRQTIMPTGREAGTTRSSSSSYDASPSTSPSTSSTDRGQATPNRDSSSSDSSSSTTPKPDSTR